MYDVYYLYVGLFMRLTNVSDLAHPGWRFGSLRLAIRLTNVSRSDH